MMSLQKTKRMEAMMRRKKAMTSRRRYWYLKDGIKININKDDMKGKMFLPGKFHCRTFHPGVMRMSKQIFQPPH